MNFVLKVLILQNLLQSVLLQDTISNKTTATIVEEHGYAVTTIEVTTEDGYKFKMFHMPASKHCLSSDTIREPVLLMHGLMSCSDSWVLNGPNDALAFLLADNCHPVYLGNSRGNIYGRKHETRSTYNPYFWKFSFHEIGYYDIAAMLRMIRATHNSVNIFYVGHSQGCAALLALLSERPEFNEWIKTSYLLAPAVYLHDVYMPPVIGTPLACSPLIPFSFAIPFKRGSLFQRVGEKLCLRQDKYCIDIPGMDFSILAENMNTTLTPFIFYNHPSGGSMNEFKHLLQGWCWEQYDFKKFNYGIAKNLFVYGHRVPPAYSLEKITTRMIIYYGDRDRAAPPSGTERLCAEKPTWVCNLVKNYNHLDFQYGLDIKEKLFQPIIEDMDSQ